MKSNDGGSTAPTGDGQPAAVERLSLNTATVRAGLLETVEACAAAGVRWIAPWREQFDGVSVAVAAKAIDAAGLKVSSLCRGGFFPAATAAERAARIDENLMALDEAATLAAEVLVLVCGGVVGRDLAGSRQMVEDGIAAILPAAEACGVKLGIEPLHPMFGADRSVIVTLDQANSLARRLASPWVGAVIDVYHVWWDPEVEDAIARTGERILAFHVNDWVVPLVDVLNGRGMMGDGVIDLRRLRRAVDGAGFGGPIEVEIFNESVRALGLKPALELVVDRYRKTVLD